MGSINSKDVEEAYGRIRKHITITPILRSRFFSSLCRADVYLKLENRQVTSSFKIRGALNRMFQLTEEEKAKGVVTASAGNHALAVAIGSQKLGLRAKIIVPETAPKKKADKIRKYDVELVIHGKTYDEAEKLAISLAKTEGRTYISPYNDFGVIAGQGTVALEILEDLPKADIILVPVGGGGLISGVGAAVKAGNPAIELVGVQSEASPAMYESLHAGKITDVAIKDSIADGLSGNIEEGSITFELAKKHVDKMILVKESAIRNAIKLLWDREGETSEGAGAVGIAAILENKELFRGKTVAVIITGGNIDDKVFEEIVKG